MKYSNIVKATLVIAATTGLATSSSSALAAATASANATATVMQSIAIAKNSDLVFGGFVPNSGGTVVMSNAGARSATGGVALATSQAGNAAQFTVTGTTGATYAITLPSTVTITSGANTMSVGTFNSNPSGTGTLTGGTQSLYVGATLTVGNAQAAGSYTGAFNVSVDYN